MAGLRPLPTELMSASDDSQYSTLELHQGYLLEHDSEAAPIVGQDPRNEKIISYVDVGKQAVVADVNDVQSESSPSAEERKIFGLRRKTFFILLAVVLILITAVAIGGGVGGTMATQDREKSASVPIPSPTPAQAPTTTRSLYTNTGLAATQWTDLNGTLHKRLYYQDNRNKIRESAWDNSTAFDTPWEVNAIGGSAKPGTPIAAAAGYPHARYNYTLVRIAYLSFSAIG